MKPGIKSTEFWALPAIMAAIAGDPDNAPWYAAIYAAYAAMRAVVKGFSRSAPEGLAGGAATQEAPDVA